MKKILEILKEKPLLIGFLIVTFILIIYLPSLNNYLMGDDFEWLNDSYSGWQNPTELLKPINNFFRPMVKLSYLVLYTLFKTHIVFYNLFTIILHLLNVFLLYYLILKVTQPIAPAALISILYGSSALYSEVTLWSAGRPDALLLAFMLAILILLNNTKDKLKSHHHILIFIFALFASASKETWILLPFLAFAFLWIVKSASFKTTLKQTLSLFILLISYLGYFIILPKLSGQASFTSYATLGIDKAFRKFGFIIYKYIGLETIYSGATWQLLLVLILILVLTAWLIMRNNRLALWGLIFMLVTIAITFPIDHFPSRYSYLPLMGFWILVIAWLEKDLKNLLKKIKLRTPVIIILVGVPIVFYLANQVIMLQWEINDYHLRGSTHKELVDMYLKVRDHISYDKPIVFINYGERKPIEELARSIKGYRKLLFIRDDAIWQELYLAPLANFAGNPFVEKMQPIPANQLDTVFSNPFTPLVFTDNGFNISDIEAIKIQDFYKKYRTLPIKTHVLKFLPIEKK